MIAKRIAQYLNYKGIAVYLAEKKINSGAGTLAKAIREDTGIGSSIIEKFLEAFPDLNPTWLLTGKGEMILSETLIENLESFHSVSKTNKLLNDIIDTQKQMLTLYEKRIELLQKRVDELEQSK